MLPSWRGRAVLLSRRAEREMRHLRLYIEDVVDILEEGRDCAASPRAAGTVERCRERRGRVVKVVAVASLSYWSGEEVWLVTHVGKGHGR